MARRIYSEDLVLNLIINGKDMPAQNKVALNELYKLDRKTRELEISLAKVEVAQRKLGPRTAKNAAEFDKLAKSAESLKIKIGQNNAAMNKLRQDIGQAGLTINQLNSYLKVLKIQLNNATDPRTMARLRKEIILTENRIKHMVTGASRLSIAFERLGTVANKFGTITSWLAIVGYAFSRAVGGTVSTLRTLDKTFSNVMKSTGLTRQEMWALKQQFDQLNINESMKTPTATKDLLEISRIAGRLGVRGVQNIADFTMAVDKLYVALGEDLQGSVEEVAEKVGKLVTTFGLTPELPLGEAMLRAGSLINQLAKSSAAGAETILNYTSRLGGVGSMAKFSMDQLAGLGAALDAVGVPAERGSTALAKLITGMGEHAEQFAMALGMSTEEYRNAMETNINETMLKLIQSSAQGNASIMDVVAGMDKMDVSGVRVMEVYGKLVQKMDLVIEQQAIAKAAFSSSASVMNEFYIMSKDFDSLMAIQGKRWKALADDYAKAVAPSVYKVYRAFTDMAYAMRDVVGWIGRHINGLWALIAVWTAFKGVRIAEMIRQISVDLLVSAVNLKHTTGEAIRHNVVVVAMKKAYISAGGGIAGFSAALKALWTIVKANPLGLIITAASLIASAFFLFRKRTDDVTKAIDEMNAAVAEQTGAMKVMFDALNKTNEETKERKQLIDDLNMMYGEYLTKLITETDTVKELADAYTYASLQMEKKIRLEAQQTKVSELSKPYEEKMSKKLGNMISELDEVSEEKMGKKINNFDRGYLSRTFGAMFDEMAEMEQYPRYVTDEMITRLNSFISSFITDFDGIKRGNNQLYLYLQQAYAQRVEIEDLKRKFLLEGKGTEKAIEEQIAKIDVGFTPVISQSEYEDQVEVAKQNSEALILQKKEEALEMKRTDDWLKKEELKAEEQHILALIEIEKKRFTATKELTDEEFRELQNKYGSLEEMEKNEPDVFWMGGGAGYGKKKELSGIDAALVPLKTQLAENRLQQAGEGKGGGGGKGKTQQQLDDEKVKEAVEKAETEHNMKLAEIKRKYFEGAYLSEDEYNDKILEQEILFLDEKLKIYKVGSIEYAETYNALLEKKVTIERNINDRILAAQKQFARIKTDRAVSEVDASLALEEERWLEEKAALESQLVVKTTLTEKEIQLNELYYKIIEAKELEHQEKLRRIKMGPQKARIETMGKTIESMRGIESETTFTNQDQLAIIKEERKKIIQQSYDEELKMAGDNSDAKLEADLKYVEANRQLQLDMFDAEQKMQLARVDMIQSYIGVLRNSVGEESKLGKALYLIGQGIAIAGIWIKVASDNAKIYSTALAEFAWMGPAAPAAAAAWAAAPMAANTTNAALNTGLILAQTIGAVIQWEKGNYPDDMVKRFKRDKLPVSDASALNGGRMETLGSGTNGTRQHAGGTYPVIGKDDGRTYDAEYVGPVKTGVYKKPSLGLFAERPEMVIDYPTLRNIQMNNPKLIEAILAHRVVNGSKQHSAGYSGSDGGARQFANGNYQTDNRQYVGGNYYTENRTTEGTVVGTGDSRDKRIEFADAELKELIRKNIEVNERMLQWKPKVYTEMIKKDLETLERIDRNRSL